MRPEAEYKLNKDPTNIIFKFKMFSRKEVVNSKFCKDSSRLLSTFYV
ncbi:unnamed protein product [marine sediment metagenome]|uniref:Uncharacterized protein n=1 Tax=marine sediment metagenome TaxID=412755 RepID=X0U2D6_9ZZZZ